MVRTALSSVCVFAVALLFAHSATAASDMPGSRDYPGLPRVEGTVIGGYQVSTYDAGQFVTRLDDKKRSVVTRPEGKRTRLLYLGQTEQTSLQQACVQFGDAIDGETGDDDALKCCSESFGSTTPHRGILLWISWFP